MYQTKEQHPLSPPAPDPLPQPVYESMWSLFLAIGVLWRLTDDPLPYRLRFRTFLENRILLNPLYAGYYLSAALMIDDLNQQGNVAATWELIFHGRNPLNLQVSPALLQAVQQHVAFEFILRRLAFGSFADFGAKAYIGYMSGANLPDQPAPYTTAEGLK